MKPLLIYIVQVNTALLLFWLFYRLLFGKDTFFGIKRLCLWSVLVVSFLYPLINLSFPTVGKQPIIRYVADFRTELEEIVVTAEPLTAGVPFPWESLLWTLYAAGIAFLLCRMAVQVAGICRLAAKGRPLSSLNTNIISPGEGVAPFSFLRWIFVNPDEYTLRELQEIVTHEKVHVRQGHSADMLISELVCVFCWFNPAAWLLRREIRQNLEFLADKDVVSSGFNRKNYQYHLLRLSHQPDRIPIATNFTVSQLKKRIVMMNKKRSSRIGLAKYLLLLPLTVCLVLAGNARALADSYGAENSSGLHETRPVTIAGTLLSGESEIDGKRSKGTITVTGKVTDEKGDALPGAIVIIKGSNIGVTTGSGGGFSLSAPENATLVCSFVGKKSIEVSVQPERPLQVQMHPEPVHPEPVVVMTAPLRDTVLSDEEVFVVVEDMPRLPVEGGVMHYINSKLVYPKKAHENGIQGRVLIKFTVTASGKVANVHVIESADSLLDAEALRVIRELPDWEPGKQRGKAVAVEYMLPVTFSLSGGVSDKTSNASSIHVYHRSRQQTNKLSDILAELRILSDALIIIDGKESNKAAFDKLSDEEIRSVTIQKNATAIETYGEKAKNGVFIIETEKQ